MSFNTWILCLLSITCVPSILVAASQQPAQRLDWSADDGRRISDLHEHGRRTEGKMAVLWSPAGVLDDGASAQLIERLDKGIAALRQLIGTHAWQEVRDEKLRFYVSDDQFVSHATSGGVVLIQLPRLRDGRAPFLHEAAHALLARPIARGGAPPLDSATQDRLIATRPQWLVEGIADHLAQTAAQMAGVSEGDVFDIGGLGKVDHTCATRMATATGKEIGRYIGVLDAPTALFTTDRFEIAPIFYACAFSYTKFLAAQIGLQELIALMELQSRVNRATDPISIGPDGVLPRVETLTGKPTEKVQAEWLKHVQSQR